MQLHGICAVTGTHTPFCFTTRTLSVAECISDAITHLSPGPYITCQVSLCPATLDSPPDQSPSPVEHPLIVQFRRPSPPSQLLSSSPKPLLHGAWTPAVSSSWLPGFHLFPALSVSSCTQINFLALCCDCFCLL